MDTSIKEIDNSLKTHQIAQELYKKNLELLTQRKRIEQLLYSISEAIVAVDTNFKITIFNKALKEMLGISDEQAIGKHIDEVVKLRTETDEPIEITKFCFSKGENNLIKAAVFKGQEREYFMNVGFSNVIKEDIDPELDECLITMTDITAEKMLDKLKDDFVSVAAHELRTPMTIIKSYLWMLGSESKGTLNDKQKSYVNIAVGGTERLIALVNDMLDISRIEQGKVDLKLESITLKDFIEEIQSQFMLKTDEKGIYLKTEYSGEIDQIYADRNKLSEIFINLLGNSIKFTDKGGVTIKAETSDETFVKISISDTGKGIDKKDIIRLFHKFGRLDNSYRTVAEAGGTGLGLYITKSLVEKMGGQIGVSSEGAGKGTTFWFTLPTKRLKNLPSEEKKEEISSIKESTHTISG